MGRRDLLPQAYYQGQLDDVSLYAQALSSSTIVTQSMTVPTVEPPSAHRAASIRQERLPSSQRHRNRHDQLDRQLQQRRQLPSLASRPTMRLVDIHTTGGCRSESSTQLYRHHIGVARSPRYYEVKARLIRGWRQCLQPAASCFHRTGWSLAPGRRSAEPPLLPPTSSGNGNNGSVTGTAQWGTAGKSNGDFVFNGVATYIDTGSANLFNCRQHQLAARCPSAGWYDLASGDPNCGCWRGQIPGFPPGRLRMMRATPTHRHSSSSLLTSTSRRREYSHVSIDHLVSQ